MTTIEEVKEEISVVEILGHYGAETWRASYHGHGWTPLNCPFCTDTNGSGSVNAAAGLFLCHQCGAPRDGKAGDIIDIVKDQELMTTREALEWIRGTFQL